ncbi:hypothetical protein A3SI_02486 [Nitritalea halalkaliphila LW7]|uniref:Endonuclease/exonuclease/phosphatase domain-containing protein n=1 Tax=Nitritalea halalkaliphila LW7 TaxID=1189621 RepID=I5C9T5_9BACT|nr:choice-of-anchor J domain-containing protein [Nitritalea halalkaliphila]EIM78587.1 hypothetical protein A3SI_02486 [Nitritalea halalkaliphila LW7]
MEPGPSENPVALLQYDLAGQPGNQASTEPVVLVSGISGQPLTRGTGLGASGAGNSFSSSGWNAGEERFFRFGFTALPGQSVDLSSLRFGYRSSNTGPTNMALRYSGDNFTQNLATFTSINAFGNLEVDLSALQGLTGPVEFRIIALDNTSANGGTVAAGGTFRVTNFFPGDQPITFTGVVRASGEAGIPFISTDPEALSFPRTSIREEGPVLSYILSARDLQGPVEISGPEVLRFSLDGSNFQAPLSIPAESLKAEALTLFVQFSSAEAINLASSIQHSTSGIPPVSLAVTGQRFDPFQIFEDFNTSCQEGLPDGWTAIAITGQQLWECTQFGRAGNNATANAPFGLQANGFANGTQQTNEQWLISPAFDLSEFDFPLLSFWTRVAFAGPRLELFIAQDFSGDPQTATWIALEDRFATENFWTFSQEIDLSDFKNAPVHLAFRYRSSPEEGAARWTLDDFSLLNSDTPPAPFLNVGIGNVDYTHFGITPEGTVAPKRYSFPVTLSNATEPLRISAAPGFEFSIEGENNFSPVLTLSPEQARSTQNIEVRFAPAFAGAFSSVIQFRSGDLEERAGFLTGATIKRKDSFDVVTWNIEWFGSEASGQGPADTQRQLENVKKILEDLDADVYAFQEITSIERFKQLADALPDYRGFISPAVSQVGDFADAQKLTFLYKTTTVDSVATRVLLEGVQESDLVGYPSSPNRFWASGRLPFLFEVETKINGVQKRINLVNIHARSNGGGESAGTPRYAMRRFDVGVLKDSLDTYYADVPLIILGDYNDDLDETVADQNAPTVNTSETSFIRFIEDEQNYTPVTLSLSKAGLRSFIARENVIDHIMISNELDQAWIVQSERVVAPFDLVPDYASSTSDHLPVKARFLLECTLLPDEISSENSSFCIGETVVLTVPESAARIQWQRLDADNNWQNIPEATERPSPSLLRKMPAIAYALPMLAARSSPHLFRCRLPKTVSLSSKSRSSETLHCASRRGWKKDSASCS